MAPFLIKGSQFADERGGLNFFNTFDMQEVVRFYEIIPKSTETIRAWQGHKKEKKWFYCHSGAFLVNLIKVDDFESPSALITPEGFILKATEPAILCVPECFASGFRALEKHSKLQVFSNLNLERSKQDDYRYPLHQWKADWVGIGS